MKEIIKGWIARDKNYKQGIALFLEDKPFLSYSDNWNHLVGTNKIILNKHHGLKPGEIKPAKITVELL